MNQSISDTPSLKQPDAFLPLVLSGAGIVMVLVYVAMFGTGHSSVPHDEGAPARIFQLLMVAQLPIAAFFGLRWMPKAPTKTLLILALQAAAGLTAIATVILFENL